MLRRNLLKSIYTSRNYFSPSFSTRNVSWCVEERSLTKIFTVWMLLLTHGWVTDFTTPTCYCKNHWGHYLQMVGTLIQHELALHRSSSQNMWPGSHHGQQKCSPTAKDHTPERLGGSVYSCHREINRQHTPCTLTPLQGKGMMKPVWSLLDNVWNGLWITGRLWQ